MRIFIAIKWYGQWWWSNGWTRFFPLKIRTQQYIIWFVKHIPYDISFYTQHIYIYIYIYTVLYISIKANDIPYHLVIYHKYGKSLFLVLWVQQHREYRVLTQNQSRQKKNKLEHQNQEKTQNKSTQQKTKTQKNKTKTEKNKVLIYFIFIFSGDSSCLVVFWWFCFWCWNWCHSFSISSNFCHEILSPIKSH